MFMYLGARNEAGVLECYLWEQCSALGVQACAALDKLGWLGAMLAKQVAH